MNHVVVNDMHRLVVGAVYRAARETADETVFWILHRAVYGVLDEAIFWPVSDAVNRAVNGVQRWTRSRATSSHSSP